MTGLWVLLAVLPAFYCTEVEDPKGIEKSKDAKIEELTKIVDRLKNDINDIVSFQRSELANIKKKLAKETNEREKVLQGLTDVQKNLKDIGTETTKNEEQAAEKTRKIISCLWGQEPNKCACEKPCSPWCYLLGGLKAKSCPGAQKSKNGDYYWTRNVRICREKEECESLLNSYGRNKCVCEEKCSKDNRNWCYYVGGLEAKICPGAKKEGNKYWTKDAQICKEKEGCPRPSDWCTHTGDTSAYEYKDCDGDGIKDHYCHDTGGNKGVIQTSANCANTWPKGKCLA